MERLRESARPCVVPGGGVVLLYAAKVLAKLDLANDDQRVGVDIVRRALQAPARQIVENAGVEGSVVVGKLLESKNNNWGFDAQRNEYVDMVKKGIIDPAKVVRTALQDASSVAGLLITTEVMVADQAEPDAPMPAPPPGGGMGF